jgi:hypothetical protein
MEISFAFNNTITKQKPGERARREKKLINLSFMSDLLPILCWIAYCFLLLFGFHICFICSSCRGGFQWSELGVHKWPEANSVPNMTRDQLLSEAFYARIIRICCIIDGSLYCLIWLTFFYLFHFMRFRRILDTNKRHS